MRIISTGANTVASTYVQNHLLENMENTSTTMEKVKARGNLLHLTDGKRVASQICNVLEEW